MVTFEVLILDDSGGGVTYGGWDVTKTRSDGEVKSERGAAAPAWQVDVRRELGVGQGQLPPKPASVPQLVLQQGSNALTICLNAVAILFLADIDNALYLFGLGDDSRARVEQCGR